VNSQNNANNAAEIKTLFIKMTQQEAQLSLGKADRTPVSKGQQM